MKKRFSGAHGLLVAVFTAGAAAAGCGGDDSHTAPTGSTDSGADTSVVSDDATGDDGSMTTPDSSMSDDVSAEASPVNEAGLDSTVNDTGTPDGALDGTVLDAAGDGSVPLSSGPLGVSATSVAFGAGLCGGAAVSKTLTVSNSGTTALTVAVAITGAAFTADNTSLAVPAGGSSTLTVKATVPGSSTAGTALAGSLKLTANDAANDAVTLALGVTPTGATLAFTATSPTTAAFPTTPLNVAATPIAMVLTNTGNASAQFTFGAPAAGPFTLTENPVSPVTLAAQASVTATAGFTPTASTSPSTTATITATGAICGQSVSSLSLSGVGAQPGQVSGFPSSGIDFGPSACGGAAPGVQTFTLSNPGGTAVHLTGVTLSGASGFTTSAANAQTIAAAGTLAITVNAPAVPTPSTLDPISATLTITTDAPGDSAHVITLTEEPQGAILAFDTTATPGFGSFGNVNLGDHGTQNFAVVNTGNAAANVTLTPAASPPYTVATGTFSLAANGSQPDSATFAPAGLNGASGTLGLTATGALCAPLPSSLSLTGFGVGGGPAVGPTSLAFAANCGGGAATPQTFQVTNNGNANMTWAMSAPTGAGAAQYAVVAVPPPGVLAPGNASTITVTPAAIPSPAANPSPAAFAAQVTITTDVPGDTAHPVSLSETPLGDQLVLSASDLEFDLVPINTSPQPQTFTLTNNANPGSADANVQLQLGGTGAGAYVLSATSVTNLGTGGAVSAPVGVTFTPTSPIAYPATVALQTGDVLCSALPASVIVNGTGSQGKVLLPTTSLTFGTDPSDPSGFVNCGATGTPQSITVTNTGNQDFHITGLALGLGAASPYVLSGTGATLPATVTANGGSVTINITPNPIPASVANPSDPSPFTDTLTVTTDAALDTPHTVHLTEQARGAVITGTPPLNTTWNFGQISLGSIGTFTSIINNTGNAPATVALSGISQPSIFNVKGGTVTAAPQVATSIVGQFIPPSASGSWSDQGTLTVSTNTAFCAPLPAQWQTPTINVSGTSSGAPSFTLTGSLAFPGSDCGSAAPAGQSVTLTNVTNQAHTYTVSASNGTIYHVGDPNGGHLAANGSAVITVTPQTVTPGAGVAAGSAAYAANLTVTIDGTTQLVTPISWTLNGAVLSLTTSTLQLSRNASNITFANAGTQTVSVSTAFTPNDDVVIGANPNQVLAGGSTGTTLTAIRAPLGAAPNCNGTRSNAVAVTPTFTYSGGAVCQPLVAPTFHACF